MFQFVCTKLVFHGSRRCTNTISRSTHYYTNFTIPVLIRWNSTSTTSKEQSFTVSYLMNSHGFSLKSALLVSKHVQFDSPAKPDSVIALLKKHGFSEKQILKLVKAFPRLLLSSPEKTLLPKFEFFYSKGFSTSELAKACTSSPYVMGTSLKNTMIPNFNHISDLVKSYEKAVAVIKSNPILLRLSRDNFVVPLLNILREMGVPDHNVVLLIRLIRWPFPSKVKLLKNAGIEVKEMGIHPSKSQFILAMVAKLYGETHWKSRIDIFKRWGWSDEDFLEACRSNPVFMLSSKDKINRVMEFLVDKLNIESSSIIRYPHIVGYSMEKRIIPRAAVFEFLLSKGLINRKNTNFAHMIVSSEKAFLYKYVNSYEEAPKLLKLYHEKLAGSRTGKHMQQ